MKKISVITACYNDYSALLRTIRSVSDQDYDIQHVVVDGGSSDGTLELLMESSKKMSSFRYISENDKGVYDAINKGVELATAEYLLVLNAGDTFSHKNVLNNIFSKKYFYNQDYLIGRVKYVNKDGVIKQDSITFPSRINIECSHQAFIYRRSIHKELGVYSLKLKSASDYEFFCRVHDSIGMKQVKKIDEFIAIREKFGGDLSDTINHTLEMAIIDIKRGYISKTWVRRLKDISFKVIRYIIRKLSIRFNE